MVVAKALGVLVISEPVYPYAEAPPIDVVMSYITGSSIQWGSDPRITSSTLFETAYLFLRAACHSLWPISQLSPDVCFCTLSCLMRLSAFLICFFVL